MELEPGIRLTKDEEAEGIGSYDSKSRGGGELNGDWSNLMLE